ncbi:MAG: hypothetical protein R3Y45_03030 [Bacillota bacterium]
MIISIIILSIFVVLVLEIPFDIFLNLSLDRVLLEYQLDRPIKTRGYAYVKNGELFHGSARKEMGGGIDTMEFLSFVSSRVIVKECHVRGILGEDSIENTMFEVVFFQNLANAILGMIRNGNLAANLSQNYHVAENEDSNIFLESMLWLSVADILSIASWYIWKKLINKKINK